MTTNENSCAVFEPLISGALDGELTQQQQQHLQQHLNHCERCRRIYDELEAVQTELRKGRSGAHPLQQNQAASVGGFWPLLGWALLVLGVLPLIAYGIYQFMLDEHLPLWVRFAIASTSLGLVVLFVYVARQRYLNGKTDNYKKVQL